MSIFSNSAAGAADRGQAYIDALCGLVAGRDPKTVLAETPPTIRAALDALSPVLRIRPEAPGKWSVRDVIQHLGDSEVAWGWRLRMIIAHNRPALTPYDQDRWADRLRYNAVDANDAFEEFDALRRGHLRLLERIPPEDLRRVAVHAEWGEVGLARLIEIEAGHDVLHLRQIERIRRAIGALV